MQLGQKQRDCQVASQPEHKKSSRGLDYVAFFLAEVSDKKTPEVEGGVVVVLAL